MPVSLELISSAPFVDEDAKDLIKIYGDNPLLIQTSLPRQISSKSTPLEQLQILAAKSDWQIAVGRFNSRLLCAMLLQHSDTQQSDNQQQNNNQQSDRALHGYALCVRDITRRRGVATQFIKLLQRMAVETDSHLYLHANAPEPASALLVPMGFSAQQQKDTDQWLFYYPKPTPN